MRKPFNLDTAVLASREQLEAARAMLAALEINAERLSQTVNSQWAPVVRRSVDDMRRAIAAAKAAGIK